jgi:hypothetical protein
MDYAGMANRIGQFRQAQVPGGGQRPMNGWGGVNIQPHAAMLQGAIKSTPQWAQDRVQGLMQSHNPMGQPSQVQMGPGVMGAFKRFGQ